MTWEDILKKEIYTPDDGRFYPDESRTEEETIKELKRIFPHSMELLENMDFKEYFKFPEEENIYVTINPDNRQINKYNMFSDFERMGQIMHVKMRKGLGKVISMILSPHTIFGTWYWEVYTYGRGNDFYTKFKGMNDKGVYNAVLEELNTK